jgi:hypothetical protein
MNGNAQKNPIRTIATRCRSCQVPPT